MPTAEPAYLLDTHTFLWMATEPDRLGAAARARIEDVESRLLLSVASVWEMAIKKSLGKLELPSSVEEFVDDQLAATDTRLLEVGTAHAGRVEFLAWHHRDPFDRLLVAQALHEGLPVLGLDADFDRYGVERIW